MLSAGVRLGGHRAQGPGHHQGAAAALISPKPATTFSGHTWGEEENKSRVPREKEQEAGELEEEEKQNEGEEQEEEEDLTRGTSTSLLPPRQELSAPTATRQLRAAFYSCMPTGNKNQYSSADAARHPPSLTFPPFLTLFPTPPCFHT